LAEQDEVKELADKHGNKDLIIVFGLNQPFTLRTMGVTFQDGDPSFSGSLGGVALGLKSYHILELKDQIPEDVWEEEMGMKEFEIEDDLVDNILKTMKDVRGEERVLRI
jgi:hypothetical protein